jgi:hypothetical protein
MHGFLFLLFAFSSPSFGMNLLLRPYDTLVRPEFYSQKTFEVTGWAETGIGHAIGFNDESQVNVLKIWNCAQDALAMLNGFPADSEIGQLRIALDAADDGVRGHFAVNGDLDLRYGAAFGARWQFYPRLWLVGYLPFYALRLHNVSWRDLTHDTTAADMRVKEMLTNDIFARVNELGDGLDLTGWSRAGLGDLNMFIEWLSHHPQNRPLLKDVALNGRVGFTFPTGVKVNADDIFSIPFGADGALGMLFGGGLWVTLSDCFQAGLDVQLWHLFGNTRCRRIKTSIDQSELLLLAKTSVYKDFGLMQRFNLFAQAYHFAGGLSALVGYQFLKKGEDSLALDTCEFSSRIANSAASLEEWTAHSFIVNLHYDFNVHRDECAIWPQLSLFARLPFNGKRAALFKTVGAYFSIDF